MQRKSNHNTIDIKVKTQRPDQRTSQIHRQPEQTVRMHNQWRAYGRKQLQRTINK